jgi:hypothetical protein
MEMMAPEPGAKPAVNSGDEGRVFRLPVRARLLRTSVPAKLSCVRHTTATWLDLGREEA